MHMRGRERASGAYLRLVLSRRCSRSLLWGRPDIIEKFTDAQRLELGFRQDAADFAASDLDEDYMPALVSRTDVWRSSTGDCFGRADIADIVCPHPCVVILRQDVWHEVIRMVGVEYPCPLCLPFDLDLRVPANLAGFGTGDVGKYCVEHAHWFLSFSGEFVIQCLVAFAENAALL